MLLIPTTTRFYIYKNPHETSDETAPISIEEIIQREITFDADMVSVYYKNDDGTTTIRLSSGAEFPIGYNYDELMKFLAEQGDG